MGAYLSTPVTDKAGSPLGSWRGPVCPLAAVQPPHRGPLLAWQHLRVARHGLPSRCSPAGGREWGGHTVQVRHLRDAGLAHGDGAPPQQLACGLASCTHCTHAARAPGSGCGLQMQFRARLASHRYPSVRAQHSPGALCTTHGQPACLPASLARGDKQRGRAALGPGSRAQHQPGRQTRPEEVQVQEIHLPVPRRRTHTQMCWTWTPLRAPRSSPSLTATAARRSPSSAPSSWCA